MFFKSNILATALLGASAVNAHLTMTNPVPYGDPSKSPLTPGGNNFPCQSTGGSGYTINEENEYAVGDEIQLTLKGTATHGGGSCQISLTTDRQPTKDSNWMVIESVEGGCPVNIQGNRDWNAPPVFPAFNFTIPDGVEPGKYTLAWTWFNRVGNREMYMNCAPVTINGGASKRSEELAVEKRSNFPSMFVANINGCTTTESKDIRFPNPGDNVQYLGDKSNLTPEGQEACSGTPSFGGGSGGSGSSSGSSPSSSSEPAASASLGISLGLGSGSSPTQSAASEGGQFAPNAASSDSSAPAPTQSAAPAAESSSSSSGSSSNSESGSSSGSSSSSSSSSGSESGECTSGQFNCLDGSSYQQCSNGKWAATMQMAAGMECTKGISDDLGMKASSSKRHFSEMRYGKRAHGGHRHA